MGDGLVQLMKEFDKYMLKTITKEALSFLKSNEPNVYHEEFMHFLHRIDADMENGA